MTAGGAPHRRSQTGQVEHKIPLQLPPYGAVAGVGTASGVFSEVRAGLNRLGTPKHATCRGSSDDDTGPRRKPRPGRGAGLFADGVSRGKRRAVDLRRYLSQKRPFPLLLSVLTSGFPEFLSLLFASAKLNWIAAVGFLRYRPTVSSIACSILRVQLEVSGCSRSKQRGARPADPHTGRGSPKILAV